MLHSFRSFMKSRIGALIALIFLLLIALAFAAGDVSSSGKFGSVTGGDRVASVGSRKLSTADLSQAATNAVEQMKRDNPRLSMRSFVASGGLAEALDQLIDRAAISVFGEDHGIVASDRLVDSEIAKIPAFQGPDGKFSEAAYKALIQQRGLSDAAVRQSLGDGLVARQILVPAAFGARMPTELASRYAALLTEKRSGAIALLPSAVFAPKGEPSPAELTSYYNTHRNQYVRPERRTIRYAVFDDSAVKNVPQPTDAEIAARYNGNKALYAPSEMRKLTQLVMPTEAAAKALVAEVNGGKSLEAAAAAKGLATATIGPIARPALVAQANEAIAAAAFSGARGKLADPVRGTLGWTVLRVDAVENKAGKTLEQARSEIAAEIAAEKKRTALSDFSAKVEDEFDKGGSLGDVIKELGLQVQTTQPLTADGRVYGQPAQTAPAELSRVLATAFSMEREGQPQLAEIEAGKKFIVFDVSQITSSAAAPLAEIRKDVIADLMLQKGAAAARSAAEKLQALARKGTDLGAALGTLGVAGLPPVQKIDMTRDQLAKAGQNVPPPLGLLFSMAKGTVKMLAGPANRGWYVVTLANIVPGDAAAIAPIVPQAQRELSTVAGREYADQLRRAVREEVGVKKNQTAIDAVSRQLTGNTGN